MKLILVTASAWEAQLSKASNNFLERAKLHIWNLEPTISFFSHEFLFIVKYRNLGDPNYIIQNYQFRKTNYFSAIRISWKVACRKRCKNANSQSWLTFPNINLKLIWDFGAHSNLLIKAVHCTFYSGKFERVLRRSPQLASKCLIIA